MGGHRCYKLCLEINNQIIPSSDTVKLLGTDINSKLKFDSHVKTMCAKANRKVSAFSMVANFITFEQAKLLYNSFIMSNFGYCPLIWMFCGKTANEEINRIHKRAQLLQFKFRRTSGQIRPKNGSFAKSSKIARGGLQIPPSNEPRIYVGVF